jgi:seryl-tRNA synthetase
MCDFTNVFDSYICYDEKSTDILMSVDNHFKQVAISLGGLEYHIPAMISKEILEKCGYFSSFPQHLTIASYLKQGEHDSIVNQKNVREDQVCNSDMYFTPAACLHIYPMLKDNNINEKIITTKARVYRYENHNFNGNTRLWDFTVREIVFIGSKKYVIEKLEYMKDITLKYVLSKKINAEIASAVDNFYPSKNNLIKQKLQHANSLKYELIVPFNNNDISIASFNYHGTHFSQAFDFDNSGQVVTGCVGYGLERWVALINN